MRNPSAFLLGIVDLELGRHARRCRDERRAVLGADRDGERVAYASPQAAARAANRELLDAERRREPESFGIGHHDFVDRAAGRAWIAERSRRRPIARPHQRVTQSYGRFAALDEHATT